MKSSQEPCVCPSFADVAERPHRSSLFKDSAMWKITRQPNFGAELGNVVFGGVGGGLFFYCGIGGNHGDS